MANANGKNGSKSAFITALAAILIGITGNLTVYFDGRAARIDARDARHDRIIRENQFFKSQCFRDRTFSLVIIGALEDAKRRANSSLKNDPTERAKAVGAIQGSISQLKIISGACKNQIPES